MRKIACFIISSIMLLAIPINSAYATSVFTIGSPQYTTGQQTMQMDVAPYIEDGRTFIPLRFVAKALGVSGSNIYYNPTTHMVSIYKDSSMVPIIQLIIGSTTMSANDTTITMDVAPEIVDGRTFLPIAWLAQAFGVNTAWDATSQTITIGDNSSSQQAIPPTPATPSLTMTHFTLTPASPVSLEPGMTVQMTATITFSDGSTQDVTNTASWSVGDSTAATVNSTGLVTAVHAGWTYVTADTDSAGMSAEVDVTTPQGATTLPSNTSQPSTVSPPIVTQPSTVIPYNPPSITPPPTINQGVEENIIATAQQSIANLKTSAQNQINQIQNSDNSLIQTYETQEQQQISQIDADGSARGEGSSVIAYDEQEVRNEYDPLIQGEQSAEQSAVNSINQTLQNGINQQEQTIAQAQAALQSLNL